MPDRTSSHKPRAAVKLATFDDSNGRVVISSPRCAMDRQNQCKTEQIRRMTIEYRTTDCRTAQEAARKV